MYASDRWEQINDAKNQFYNLVSLENGVEDIGVGNSLWTDQEFLTYECITPNLNIGDVEDITMLENDLITSTGIPPDELIQGRSGTWGDSGKALVQQSKPFARQIYRNQTPIVEQLIYLVKIQCMITGEFNIDEEDFEISMNFPVIEESRDRLSFKSDLLRLTQDIISSLSTALAIPMEEIPVDIIKSIFTKYSFLNSEEIEDWFKELEAAKLKSKKDNQFFNNNNDGKDKDVFGNDPSEKDSDIESSHDYNKRVGNSDINISINKSKAVEENIRRKINESINQEIFNEAYFNSKKKLGLSEGVMGYRHYMTSFHSYDKNLEILKMFLKEKGLSKNKNKLED
jgi:hypothetical protein